MPRPSPRRGRLAGLVLALGVLASPAEAKESFRVAWSIYVGWMPWGWAADAGVVKKWADRYGIAIEVVQVNDYVESINQYTAGGFDGCVMTNMDALTIPAVGGVDSTALIVGDFSAGNDGIVSRRAKTVAELKGGTINLVELSVSHYLLARALDEAGLSERDVTVVNTSDADIVSAFTGSPDVETVVTWNPLLAEAAAAAGAAKLYDSSRIPGEIIDLMVVNTEELRANPDFGRALVGIWYETLGVMTRDDAAGRAARAAMATASGTDLEGFEAQLAATRLFARPADAVAFATSPELPATMDRVRRFSHDHGLMGEDVDAIGIAFPGTTLGDPDNVTLRFDPSFMRLAAENRL